MRFVRHLVTRLVAALVVPLLVGWYVVARFFADASDPWALLPLAVALSVVVVVIAATSTGVSLGSVVDRALEGADDALRARAAEAALRLPSRVAAVLLAVAAGLVVVVASFELHQGAPRGLVLAGAAAGAGFGLMGAMLGYSVSLGSATRALVALGPVDVATGGTVRAKVLAVFGALLAMTALLIAPLSYVRYRADLERARVEGTIAAQRRVSDWIAAGRAADAAQLVQLATGAVTVVADERGRILARAPEDTDLVDIADVPPGDGVERIAGGRRVRRRAGDATVVSFVPDASDEQGGAPWGHAALIGTVLAAACAVVAWLAVRSLTVPVRILGTAAHRVAAGDLRASPPSVSRDELGRLAADFRTMAHGLAALVTDVQAATAGVQDGVREMGEIGERVSGRAREERGRIRAVQTAVEAMQGPVRLVGRGVETLSGYVHSTSAAVGDMAAALEDVRRQAAELEHQMDGAGADVRRLSDAGRRAQTQLGALGALAVNAQATLASVSGSLAGLETSAIASQLAAAQAAELADQAGIVVHDTVDGIESLRAAVADAKRRVAVLWRRSDDIDKILDFIGEVAGRTNLLSLNASIIATQAGEHGKAFAVVAEQIRELAAQISSSTKSIGQIVRAVRDDVGGTARLIDRGDELAGEGVAHARRSLGALQEIRTATARGHETAAAIRDAVQAHAVSTREVGDLVSSVAGNSQSLSEAIEMVGTSVGAVGSVSAGIRALADGVSRALEEQASVGRRQLASLALIDSMLSEIARGVEGHEAATGRVREVLEQLTATAAEHEAAVVELSGVASRLGARSRALADRVGKFKI